MSNSIQCCFKRYEKKYLITREQQSVLLGTMKQHMQADTYGEYTVCNIYYDTDDWKLIRTSIEKPVYKEKLRVRSYGVPAENEMVFIELKKKYDGVVYKRRMTADAYYAKPFLCGSTADINETQIEKEIKWFQKTYHSKPKVFIAYERTAFAGISEPDLRITFDTGIRWRDTDLDLCLGDYGQPVISPEKILMEIKIPGTAPLWLSHILSETGAFPTTFSKYGTCYRDHIMQNQIGQIVHSAIHTPSTKPLLREVLYSA